MGRIDRKLEQLGEILPVAKIPVANYLGCKLTSNTLYVSGRVSEARGEVGSDLTVDEARLAARSALLDVLAIVKAEIGDLDRISSVLKMNGFVRSAATFTEQPHVLDGASDLLIELFGDSGRHARTATGVTQLPFGAAVQLEMILTLSDT